MIDAKELRVGFVLDCDDSATDETGRIKRLLITRVDDIDETIGYMYTTSNLRYWFSGEAGFDSDYWKDKTFLFSLNDDDIRKTFLC